MAGPHNGICLMKYAIWVYVAKYYWTLLNIVILFIIQARVLKYFRTIESIDSGPFPMFFSNIFLTHFWRKFLRFKGTFYVHRKAYSLGYWNRSASVRQSVSPAVRQSTSQFIRICNPFLNHPRVPGLFKYNHKIFKHAYNAIKMFIICKTMQNKKQKGNT